MRVQKVLFLLVLTIFISSFLVEAAKKKSKGKALSVASRTDFVTTYDKRSLYVSSLSPGKSCAIIFVHGLFESSDIWFQQYLNWHPNCSTVVYDSYGHGLSTGIKPKRDDTVQIKDLTAIMKWTKATNIILVGHNYGGVAIQQYVQKYPTDKRIVALSLVDTFARNPNPYRQGGDQPIISLLASNVYKQDAIIACQLALINPAEPHDLAIGAWEILAGSGLTTNLQAANQIILTNVSFVGSKFTKPVQILYGALDSIISPQNWNEMKSIYKNSQLNKILDGSHSPHLQTPAEFNSVLQTFIDKVTKGIF